MPANLNFFNGVLSQKIIIAVIERPDMIIALGRNN
jgi:hypothetical protein